MMQDRRNTSSRRPSTKRADWRWIFRLALLLSCGLPATPVHSQASTAPGKPFIWVADGEPTSYAVRWASMIYREAFRRLGIPLQFEHYTLARRTALVEEGVADGEVSRVYGYGNNRPNLVRVEESLIDLTFSLYTANPSLRLERLEDLRASNYLVEYRRGIMICETTLKPAVPAERVSDVSTQEQGLKKLVAGRTDLYCDLDLYVRQELQSPKFKGVNTVRKVIGVGNAVPTYPYLNKKHAELAPRLAAVLKQMKAEGLIEAYRLQVERDLGWQ